MGFLIFQVLLYPGILAGSMGQRFESMVERGGPRGELVQWADLSACLTILGQNLTFSTSQHHLHRFQQFFILLVSDSYVCQSNKEGH